MLYLQIMLINIFLILQLTIASDFDEYFLGILREPLNQRKSTKFWSTSVENRQINDYSEKHPTCSLMGNTQKSPFVVYVLYKTSGHFLGMGSIIDRKTILTSYKVISKTIQRPEDVLVLAGSLTPWWGKDSQVRNVRNAITNEYELALLQIYPSWVFNDMIKPIKLNEKLYYLYTPIFGRFYATFGITLDSYFTPGDKIRKSVFYSVEVDCSVHDDWQSCYLAHKSLDPPLNQSVHICFYPNETRCHGILGSPVVGVNEQGKTRLVGVIIRTECLDYERMHVAVKLSYFDKFIKSNSLLP